MTSHIEKVSWRLSHLSLETFHSFNMANAKLAYLFAKAAVKCVIKLKTSQGNGSALKPKYYTVRVQRT